MIVKKAEDGADSNQSPWTISRASDSLRKETIGESPPFGLAVYRLHSVRLLDSRTQETYFLEVLGRYNQVKSTHGLDNNNLDDAFASLSLDENSSEKSKTTESMVNGLKSSKGRFRASNSTSYRISTILMAMRKLREAIVASARKDTFALKVYTFIIRSTILMGHMESYHPALLHLLHTIHPVVPLAESEYHEFLGYYILDLACRQNDLAAAYHVKCHYKYKDARIEAILRALAHGNWCTFWMLEGRMETPQRRLMQWANEGIRAHALNCLGKSYLSVDRRFLENAARRPWEELREKNDLGWQLNEDVITIRKISRK